MNFILRLFSPPVSGCFYGISVAFTKDDIKKNIREPILIRTVDIVSTGCIYAFTADLASKTIFPKNAKYAMSSLLLSVGLYKILKK